MSITNVQQGLCSPVLPSTEESLIGTRLPCIMQFLEKCNYWKNVTEIWEEMTQEDKDCLADAIRLPNLDVIDNETLIKHIIQSTSDIKSNDLTNTMIKIFTPPAGLDELKYTQLKSLTQKYSEDWHLGSLQISEIERALSNPSLQNIINKAMQAIENIAEDRYLIKDYESALTDCYTETFINTKNLIDKLQEQLPESTLIQELKQNLELFPLHIKTMLSGCASGLQEKSNVAIKYMKELLENLIGYRPLYEGCLFDIEDLLAAPDITQKSQIWDTLKDEIKRTLNAEEWNVEHIALNTNIVDEESLEKVYSILSPIIMQIKDKANYHSTCICNLRTNIENYKKMAEYEAGKTRCERYEQTLLSIEKGSESLNTTLTQLVDKKCSLSGFTFSLSI